MSMDREIALIKEVSVLRQALHEIANATTDEDILEMAVTALHKGDRILVECEFARLAS